MRYLFTKLFVAPFVFTVLGVLVAADAEIAAKLVRGSDEISRALRALYDLGGRGAVAALWLLLAAPFYLWWWSTWPLEQGDGA